VLVSAQTQTVAIDQVLAAHLIQAVTFVSGNNGAGKSAIMQVSNQMT
jgi:predicted ATPase